MVNGTEQTVEGGLDLATFLEQMQVNRPQVAVEVNQELVPRERHGDWVLQEGDRLEIVTLVGGG